MKKTATAITILWIFSLFLTACTPQSALPLKTGSYTVTFDDFDSTGWKAFLKLDIKDNKIIEVEYDYIGSPENGDILKSADLSYAEAMYSITGTKPELYIRQLEESLLEHQDPDRVDAVSGATTSTKDFKELAEILMDAAREGVDSPISVPQNE